MINNREKDAYPVPFTPDKQLPHDQALKVGAQILAGLESQNYGPTHRLYREYAEAHGIPLLPEGGSEGLIEMANEELLEIRARRGSYPDAAVAIREDLDTGMPVTVHENSATYVPRIIAKHGL